jgi:hypothetical protein
MVIDTLNLKVQVPCIQGFFGQRLVTYSTQVQPKQLVNLLGHDPRSKNWKRLPDEQRNIYEYLQRKTDKSRREGVAGYIEERFGENGIAIGAFPAISIAFQQPAQFFPNEGSKAVGLLDVDITPSNVRILIDGVARATGGLDLEEQGMGELLDHYSLPVTIYAPRMGTKPLTWREMGQLFHDFNFRVQPVSKQHAIALDTSDLYIALAERLGECSVIKDNGGVAERTASLGKKSSELVVQTVLVRTVRGACEGRRFQESDLAATDNPNLTRETMKALLASIDEFFTGIATRMGKDRFTDKSSLHLSAPGWQALGVIHHDIAFRLKLQGAERDNILSRIASFDWRRSNPEWITRGVALIDNDKKTGEPILDEDGHPKIILKGAGRTNTQAIIDVVREVSGIAAMLPANAADGEEAQVA